MDGRAVDPRKTPGGPTIPDLTASDMSRYFAAAAYRDGQFRRQVLKFMRQKWYQAQSPEFGIDDALVGEHCRRAELRERVRDLLMVATFLTVCCIPIFELLASPMDAAFIVPSFASNLIIGLILASLILFAERLLTQHYTTARTFARPAFVETAPKAAPPVAAQNLIVYGGYSPFVGSGYDVGGWSFSVNLERTKDEFGVATEMLPFAAGDLLNYVRRRLNRLQNPALQHYYVLFVDGRMLRDSDVFLANGAPMRQVPEEILARFADQPQAGARTYLCVQIRDWGGEIVLSIYLRCRKAETNLFLEASYFLLAPPKRAFFEIDEVDPEIRITTILRLFTRSVITSAFVLLLAVFRLAQWAQSPLAHWFERRRIRRSMARNPRFNLGATTSIREIGMENYFRVYFQRLDKERRLKTVEQCAIDAIVDFLGRHNIDTSDIKDRKTAILNNGIIMAGGDLNAENLAVGSGAKAIFNRVGAAAGLNGGRTVQPDARKVA